MTKYEKELTALFAREWRDKKRKSGKMIFQVIKKPRLLGGIEGKVALVMARKAEKWMKKYLMNLSNGSKVSSEAARGTSST